MANWSIFTASSCYITADNAKMLKGFATILLVASVASHHYGVTYFRRVIRRDEEPLTFWGNIGGMLFIVATIAFILLRCDLK